MKEEKNWKNDKRSDYNDREILPENSSCTACHYYHKALYILFTDLNKPCQNQNTVVDLLQASIEQINGNYNEKFYTILARILSDWGNVFFSCDKNKKQPDNLEIYINYVAPETKEDNKKPLLDHFDNIINLKAAFINIDIAFAMYTISSEAYRKVNLYKRSSFQLYKMLYLFKYYDIDYNDYIKPLSRRAIHYLWYANDDLNVLELMKRKKDFGKEPINKLIPLQSLLADSEITKVRILVKELKLKSVQAPKDIKKYYKMRITSPYKINYSIVGRIYRLRLKTKVNYKAYQMLLEKTGIPKNKLEDKKFVLDDFNMLFEDADYNEFTKDIFGKNLDIIQGFENLIAESIYCLTDIAQLLETMEETYLFPHSFTGLVHEHLSFWVRQFEAYEKYKKKNPEANKYSHIEKYLKQYLDEEWREQLYGYRENQRALSHYYKCLEMHSEGRAYHNMIDLMCYLKDEYNDRSDHFNIAVERRKILKNEIADKINTLENFYKESKLYKC
jgi:hypothetical protein